MEPYACECQESRIGKAVEVMIQHVENLRRMYTKEHAELLELRETLMQNERSFGSQTERGLYRRLRFICRLILPVSYHFALTFSILNLSVTVSQVPD